MRILVRLRLMFPLTVTDFERYSPLRKYPSQREADACLHDAERV